MGRKECEEYFSLEEKRFRGWADHHEFWRFFGVVMVRFLHLGFRKFRIRIGCQNNIGN